MGKYKGGYTLVDFGGKDIDPSAQINIEGIYQQFDRAYKTGKQVICENLKLYSVSGGNISIRTINASLQYDSLQHYYMLNFIVDGTSCYMQIHFNDDVYYEEV